MRNKLLCIILLILFLLYFYLYVTNKPIFVYVDISNDDNKFTQKNLTSFEIIDDKLFLPRYEIKKGIIFQAVYTKRILYTKEMIEDLYTNFPEVRVFFKRDSLNQFENLSFLTYE